MGLLMAMPTGFFLREFWRLPLAGRQAGTAPCARALSPQHPVLAGPRQRRLRKERGKRAGCCQYFPPLTMWRRSLESSKTQ